MRELPIMNKSSKKRVLLTKTDFITYLDAPRHLWAIKNGEIPQQEINTYVQHLFEQGYDVERNAEKYIHTVLVEQYSASAEDVLIQPTSQDGEFEARTDVLIRNPETQKWDMYEIKSSTSVTKRHKFDATFQKLVFSKHYDLGKIFIFHLNKEYTLNEELNLVGLFRATDITEETEALKEKVHLLRYEALDTLREEDYVSIAACIRPKTCPCIDLCHKDLPEYSIYDVNNLTASEAKIRELEKLDVHSVYDIPLDFPLTEKQRFQVQVAVTKTPHIDLEGIKQDLAGLEYPLYFIDYESFNPAVPMYKGYRPYDQIPFQWSLHIKAGIGDELLQHHEFIETEQVDPVPNFLTSLQKIIGEKGSIVVWNKTFEGTQNRRMGEIHPEFREFCDNMNSRMYDLMDIFRDGIYADAKFKGSYSIKKVLPVLVPELSYEGMEIGEGATAMASWNEMVNKSMNSGEKEVVKVNLLKYCELDTFAMVKIFLKLHELI